MPGSDHRGPPARLPLTFEIDGERFTLPDLDTRTWLDALALEPPGSWLSLVPLRLDGDGPDRLWQRLMDPADPFDLNDAEHVAVDVLGAAVGMDLWAANRLAATAYSNWLGFDGWSYTRGLDPLREPIGRVLAGCYSWCVQQCEQDKMTALDQEIWSGPPELTPAGGRRPSGEEEPVPAWATEEREAEAFDQFMRMFG